LYRYTKGEVSIKLSDGKEVNSLTTGGYFGGAVQVKSSCPIA
jgi:hypothetical protein